LAIDDLELFLTVYLPGQESGDHHDGAAEYGDKRSSSQGFHGAILNYRFCFHKHAPLTLTDEFLARVIKMASGRAPSPNTIVKSKALKRPSISRKQGRKNSFNATRVQPQWSRKKIVGLVGARSLALLRAATLPPKIGSCFTKLMFNIR
jgi:hypothetical protein